MTQKTDRNGETVELGYNLYGAPLFKKAKGSTLGDFYEYTPEGLLKCAISQGMRYAYEYDAMDRLARKSASGRTLLAMAYDHNGNKIKQTDVSGKVTEYAYSPLDLLEKVWDDGRDLAEYAYNADGTLHEERHGPLHKRYWYDLDKNLAGIRIHSGEEMLVDNQYFYDSNGNRTHKHQLGGDTLYHYDPLNQLKKVEYPGYTEELFYDKAGNRTRKMAQGVEELYQYDPRNRLIALTKGGVTTRFQYDNAGNLLVDDKARYSYDAFNRTVKVETFDGNVQINRYDAEGLRYEMEENGNLVQFIFNQNREVVTEEDSTGLTRLIRSTELIARSTDVVRTYYHYASDEMGSTTHIVDETGEVQNRYAYDAWGNITAREEAVPNRFKFTGQQLDPITQQYYLRARFYNPVIARFTQEDTYRGDGLNLYAYCANNPVFYADPTGNEKDTLGQRYKQQEIDNYVANKRAGLDTGDVPPEIAAQGNAAIKALEAIDKQLGYSKQDPAAGETNRSANRVDAPQADVPSASNKMEGGSHSRWWHENYVDNLSDIQILLGVKQSNKGLSTLGSATRETAMAAGKAWVGDQYKEIFDSSGNIIGYSASDGMRAFRIQYKPKEGMYRANFQENMMVSNPFPNRGEHRSELKNVHIDILD